MSDTSGMTDAQARSWFERRIEAECNWGAYGRITRGVADHVEAIIAERDSFREEAIALRKDAARWRGILPLFEFENDQDTDSGKWYSMAWIKDGSIPAPGSPYYTSVEQVIDAALASTLASTPTNKEKQG